MADVTGLLNRYRSFTAEILKLAKRGERILVVTHVDADGLASGSMVYAALAREEANVTLRTIPNLDSRAIVLLEAQRYDFYIFTDLASTLIAELGAHLDGRYLVIDHHQLSDEDMRNPAVINAWAYGFDGGKEACSSSMAYFFAKSADSSNGDLSPLAVVGAVADRQDVGPGRSLIGLNRIAMEEARSSGLLVLSKDLMFTSRETRPIHESVALTLTPFLKGLTGSKDAVLSVLHESGLPLKDGGVWRTISSLSTDEKLKLTEVIASMLGPVEGATDAIANLVGEVYTLEFEDLFTPLRDAREFATLLNACGRMAAPGTGISICLGDRFEALKTALKTLSEYRLGISRALEALTGDASRLEHHGRLVLVKGGGIVDEKLLGPVVSILAASPGFEDKVLVGMSSSVNSELKVSSRVGDSFTEVVNLGSVMREAAESVGGVGGGHMMAAGAKIPAAAEDAFSTAVMKRILG